jgi:hypothetical protein
VFEAEEPDPVLETDPVERLESAILSEDADDEAQAQLEVAQSLLEDSWDESPPSGAKAGVRLGADLGIVSVGEARRVGERAGQLPLVLGDGEGATSTLVLTIQLDPLLTEGDD